eukprot:Hpha_TRINITY_DN15821_c4_g2::TRINITY_DN15821_c4_g2_i1::g.188596::m.188596
MDQAGHGLQGCGTTRSRGRARRRTISSSAWARSPAARLRLTSPSPRGRHPLAALAGGSFRAALPSSSTSMATTTTSPSANTPPPIPGAGRSRSCGVRSRSRKTLAKMTLESTHSVRCPTKRCKATSPHWTLDSVVTWSTSTGRRTGALTSSGGPSTRPSARSWVGRRRRRRTMNLPRISSVGPAKGRGRARTRFAPWGGTLSTILPQGVTSCGTTGPGQTTTTRGSGCGCTATGTAASGVAGLTARTGRTTYLTKSTRSLTSGCVLRRPANTETQTASDSTSGGKVTAPILLGPTLVVGGEEGTWAAAAAATEEEGRLRVGLQEAKEAAQRYAIQLEIQQQRRVMDSEAAERVMLERESEMSTRPMLMQMTRDAARALRFRMGAVPGSAPMSQASSPQPPARRTLAPVSTGVGAIGAVTPPYRRH